MSFITDKRIVPLIIVIIGLFVWNFNLDTKKIGVSKDSSTSNGKLISKTKHQQTIKIPNNISPLLEEKIVLEKQKLHEKRTAQEKFLQARSKYIKQEQEKQSSYLNNKLRYSQASYNQVKRKLDTIKSKREFTYKQNFKQQNAYKGYEKQSQSKKRVSLNNAKIKSISRIQKKQLLNQKYNKGE